MIQRTKNTFKLLFTDIRLIGLSLIFSVIFISVVIGLFCFFDYYFRYFITPHTGDNYFYVLWITIYTFLFIIFLIFSYFYIVVFSYLHKKNSTEKFNFLFLLIQTFGYFLKIIYLGIILFLIQVAFSVMYILMSFTLFKYELLDALGDDFDLFVYMLEWIAIILFRIGLIVVIGKISLNIPVMIINKSSVRKSLVLVDKCIKKRFLNFYFNLIYAILLNGFVILVFVLSITDLWISPSIKILFLNRNFLKIIIFALTIGFTTIYFYQLYLAFVQTPDSHNK